MNERVIRNFLLELIDTGQKTVAQVSRESRIPQMTIYMWIISRRIRKSIKKPDTQ
ncbi:hypothetical protein HNP38_000812 [Chryseobacterium defluvii]|uniref:Transposase n=1 Tax=Chryseobacterium defluvii TaxID=160396 RepID=A0A840KDC3_9FLAO|nr:hypothetical protein [Chryseobacterium defluvii]